MGTQDSLGEAEDFVDQFGLTIPMLWDESFQSWAEMGITGQPFSVLVAADGTELGRWVGVDEEAVLNLV